MVEKLVVGIHGAVAAAGHFAVPVVQGEEEFLIVAGGVFAGLDQQEAVLAGVLGFFQIGSGKGVGVIPAKACGVGREGVADCFGPGLRRESWACLLPWRHRHREAERGRANGRFLHSAVWLVTSMVTGWPSLKRSSGPGTCWL